ncbi:endonuclease/exonuclease/phosphatase family protein [Pseudoalteromonas carrageenovora]|uniref:endonuclease/exonuclease/phosphatase family protein n=1 Tax=Pseudoalteromonas carrageenovora TaxID=227 RepID=UPI002FCFA943
MKLKTIYGALVIAASFSFNALASESLRIATFNVSMDATNHTPKGEQIKSDALANALKANHQQIKNIAEIIQRVRPDIILLNEFDYIPKEQGIEYFKKHYLNVSQNNQQVIDFPYSFIAPVNTGLATHFDLDNDGKSTGIMADAQGFGFFEGHYGMAVLSKYPIDFDKVRTLQKFKYKDMPNAQMPTDPKTGENWYNKNEWQALRLSSKSFWDLPVKVNNKTVHVLASHPTPPVFDGDEDRNGKRNHDEVRLIADYVSNKAYIYDDKGQKGGLKADSRFIILGDLNASPEGDKARTNTTDQILKNALINASFVPQSAGAKEQYDTNEAQNYTANWQARVDYVLPSNYGLKIKNGGVFWPTKSSNEYRLIKDRNASSDHHLVWLDLIVE